MLLKFLLVHELSLFSSKAGSGRGAGKGVAPRESSSVSIGRSIAPRALEAKVPL
jgi:hypothetical protein